jgi:hypothetical protein
MKKMGLVVFVLLMLVAKSHAIIVHGFPGLDKLIEMSDTVMIVHIDRHDAAAEVDGWGRYECSVLLMLKGAPPAKDRVALWLNGGAAPGRGNFQTETVQLVFLRKESTYGADYRAPAVRGAVMRASPSSHQRQPKGDTVRERIEHVIREGRDFCKELYDKELKLFSAALGEVPAVTPPPKR